MPESSSKVGAMLNVSKGVARGHILCCCAVVFVCFMLTCLNLYMMSSTRSVLRHLDARLDAHPRNLQLPQQQQQLQLRGEDPMQAAFLEQQRQALEQAAAQVAQVAQVAAQVGRDEADDFILLTPGDLDNAWATQTGRLLVPVGQPEQEDDGWKQMQVQLAGQADAQQRHIESLHDKLADQYLAREALQRDQHALMREQQKMSLEHQERLAEKERQLLKEKHRALKKGAKHKNELRRVKSEVEELKKVVEAVKSLDPAEAQQQKGAVETTPATTSSTPSSPGPSPTSSLSSTMPAVSNDILFLQQQQQQQQQASSTTEKADGTAVPQDNVSLDHIFSAVFGPNPGSFFFPSYSVAADQDQQRRQRRDAAGLGGRRDRRLARLASRLGARRRRHNAEESGPMMRIEDGHRVPLFDNPAALLQEEEGRVVGARRRRLAAHAHRRG